MSFSDAYPLTYKRLCEIAGRDLKYDSVRDSLYRVNKISLELHLPLAKETDSISDTVEPIEAILARRS